MSDPGTSEIELRTFGAIQVSGTRGSVSGAGAQPKRVALLVYLAVESARGFVQRDRLVALLWPELDQPKARHALSQALSDLRKSLGTDPFLVRGNEAVRMAREHLWCDAVAFSSALADSRPTAAVELYSGVFLEGFHLPGVPDFERWLDDRQRHFRERAAAAAIALAETAISESDATSASHWARRAASILPYDEARLRQLLRLLDALGDRAGAIELFEVFRRNLEVDYGASPSPETLTLAEDMRSRPTDTRQPSLDAVDRWKPGASAPGDDAHPTVARPIRTVPARSIPRRGGGLALAAATVLAIAGAAWALTRGDSVPLADESFDVAVVPFDVLGDTALAFLSEGMVDLLGQKLNDTEAFRAVSPVAQLSLIDRENLDPSNTTDQLRIGRALETDGLLVGRIVVADSVLDLSARLLSLDDEQEVLGEASVRGPLDQLFTLIDNLAADLLVDREGDAIRLNRAAAATTDSLRALMAFLRGESAYRRGAYGRAREHFGEAIEIDSAFALAHYRLATTSHWVGTNKTTYDAIDAARRHGDRLSDHDRDLVEAFYLLLSGAAVEADEAYGDILAKHFDDPEAWYQFADNAFHYGPLLGRPVSDSERGFREVLGLNPGDFNAVLHLARVLAVDGDLSGLDSLIRSNFPDQVPWTLRALRGFGSYDAEESETVTRWLAERNHPDMFAWRVATFTRNLDAAKRLAEIGTLPPRPPEARLRARVRLALFDVATGSWRNLNQRIADIREFDAATADQYHVWLLTLPFAPSVPAALEQAAGRLRAWDFQAADPVREYVLGRASLRLGDSVAVERHLSALRETEPVPARIALEVALANGLLAEIALAKGDTARAISLVDQSEVRVQYTAALNSPFHSRADQRYLRATLLQASGQLREALRWYEALIAFSEYDLVYLGPSLFAIGSIHEQLGEREAARQAYSEFLRLWEESDPRFQPMVDSAAAGLARVRSD